MKKEGCPNGSLTLKNKCLTTNQIKKMFITEAKKTWSNGQNMTNKIDINVSIQDCKEYLALVRKKDAHSYAIGNFLVQTPKKITLKICDNLQKISITDFKKLVRHETLHMGYPRHDKNFRHTAHRQGIPVSFNEMEGGQVELRGKPKDERFYHHIKDFGTPEEAYKYIQGHPKDIPYKWEVRY